MMRSIALFLCMVAFGLPVQADQVVVTFTGEIEVEDSRLAGMIGSSVPYNGEAFIDTSAESHYSISHSHSTGTTEASFYPFEKVNLNIFGYSFEISREDYYGFPNTEVAVWDGTGTDVDQLNISVYSGPDETIPHSSYEIEIAGFEAITNGPSSTFNEDALSNIDLFASPSLYKKMFELYFLIDGEYFSIVDHDPIFSVPGGATNYGLFIGAYHSPDKDDPDYANFYGLLDFHDFRKNAKEMAAAFNARLNSKAYTLTGDLTPNSFGQPIDPISVSDIQNKLYSIRSELRRGDTLTIYINNHGASAYKDPSSGQQLINEAGLGDEFIRVGDDLYDNHLADLLADFDGFRLMVFLDSCHGGGFWGSSDPREIDGLGYKDLNQLNNIALYSGASEQRPLYAPLPMSFWGKALLEAFKQPKTWSPSGLADFLEERTLELAWFSWQAGAVWYTLGFGDAVQSDIELIETFDASSIDFDNDENFFGSPNPELQFDSLISALENVGPGSSLYNKMTDAKSYFENDDVISACATLEAFAREVNAQTGKKISEDEAVQFNASAEFTMASIGCY